MQLLKQEWLFGHSDLASESKSTDAIILCDYLTHLKLSAFDGSLPLSVL